MFFASHDGALQTMQRMTNLDVQPFEKMNYEISVVLVILNKVVCKPFAILRDQIGLNVTVQS